ncbi:MAG: N-acetyltransferase [Candidatus Marinimicrobia bacterium]|jgi:arylamine N-acetyltransferase|nr:N-acetyltransferase [Candidatus Neomarinimicrobiota bacterium]
MCFKKDYPVKIINNLLEDFSDIPYENLSKILRLPLKRHQRPRSPETLISEFLQFGRGGTCFSLNYTVMKALRLNGYPAWPVSVHTGRNSFPHYATIFSLRDQSYLVDPGYLLYTPLCLKEKGSDYGTNGVLDYELSKQNGVYTLYSIDSQHRKIRYTFTPKPVSDSLFIHHWIRSYDYISALVASRIVDNSILYINDDYIRFTDAHSVQKSYDIDKANKYLSQYFGFTQKEIDRARSILKIHKS